MEFDDRNVITLRIDPKSFYDGQFSDIFEDVSLIQLETTTESLLGEIGKIEIKGEKIFIHDRSLHEMKIFSIDGKYLGKISNKHNGSGGYFDISSFSVSKNGELIEIYDNRGFKFRIYNLNNEFVEEFPIKC
ncbi:6-bladed beta-propeller [Alkaliflexus imshenetskii]|uniref:6-bladed beta-propeller n=1 Tax=Alkaliflexus imshenetskii TaxID=286730 RepID=UPI00047A33F3|nr:6-bladed beta-propeller [Alkaliflexus imshenetskii]